MSLRYKYTIIDSVDFNESYSLFGDISSPRKSIDGSKMLLKLNDIPIDLIELSIDEVREIMETDEWSVPFELPSTEIDT
jgi:hypothetical protein